MEKIFSFKWKKEYFFVILVMIIFVIGIIFYYLMGSKETVIEVDNDLIKLDKKEDTKKIKVDIKGQIKNPGVYEVEEHCTVIDLINNSGGLLESADTTYLNLSKKLKDEMVVIIYSKEEINNFKKDEITIVSVEKCVCPKITNDGCLKKEEVISNKKESDKTPTSDPNAIININSATIEQLQTLTGIGPSRANDIIKYREQKGGFKKIEELQEVKGIGEAIYSKIKSRLTI